MLPLREELLLPFTENWCSRCGGSEAGMLWKLFLKCLCGPWIPCCK